MPKRKLLAALLCLAVASLASEALAQEPAPVTGWSARSRVEVTGQQLGSRLDLSLRFEAGAAPAPYDALALYAEPRHQLLTALVRPSGGLRVEALARELLASGPLAFSRSEVSSVAQYLILPTSLGSGERAPRLVVVAYWNGRGQVVSGARINAAGFSFSTSFLQTAAGPESYMHCCGGTHCSRQCISCKSPFFFCDLIDCTIECLVD
ncbi:MAG TPA: hypothetical protein PK413_09595 [Thermoanaerobaculia bacterium]|nr:hypothetical protein [Thermoanaerobaculia bacterium]